MITSFRSSSSSSATDIKQRPRQGGSPLASGATFGQDGGGENREEEEEGHQLHDFLSGPPPSAVVELQRRPDFQKNISSSLPPPPPTDFSFSSWNKRQKVFWSFFCFSLFQSVFDKPWDIFMRSPSTPMFYHLGVFWWWVESPTSPPPFFSSGKNQVDVAATVDGRQKGHPGKKDGNQKHLSFYKKYFPVQFNPFLLFCNKFYRMAVAINKWRRAGGGKS